jgi:hypothetical protein
MLTQRCRGGQRFAEVSVFHYRGSARSVRIWDESFMPGEEFSVSTDELASLLQPVRDRCSALASAIEDLQDNLKAAKANKRMSVPDVQGLGGHQAAITLKSVAMDLENAEPVRTAAQNLLDISGMYPMVCHDISKEEVKIMLDYRDTIPTDLAPMVILDASGRCRDTYRLMEKHRNDIVRHDVICKNYSNLEIGVWAYGGGKSAFAQDGESKRMRGIAQTVMERPDEEWLIIHHKDRRGTRTFPDQLRDFLSDEVLAKVSFLHWGNHHGTNDFAHIENVILAGTFFLPDDIYEGRARLAAGMCDEDKVHANTKRAVKEGEHQHCILQALCRASVRGIDAKGQCRPCRAYIIASNQSGIKKLLPDLLPSCNVRPWKPVPERVKGKVKEVVDQVDWILWHEATLWDIIPFNWLADQVGIKSKSNFRRTIRKNAGFQDAMQERGLEEAEFTEEGRTLKGLAFVESAFPNDPSAAYTATDYGSYI